MERKEKILRELNEVVRSYNQSNRIILINRTLMKMFAGYMIEELDKAGEEGFKMGQVQRLKDMTFKVKGKIPEYNYYILEKLEEELKEIILEDSKE